MERFLCILVCLVCATDVHGQRRRDKEKEDPEAHKLDPYTENKPAALKALGYEGQGAFHFAAGLSTADVDESLSGPRVRWIETAHFRIGSSLPEYTPGRGDRLEKQKLTAELKRLKEKLPAFSTRARKLDPWLRLHLFALRLEEHYAKVERLLGVDRFSFPTRPGLKVGGRYMGEGPYLGMQSKFNILFFEKASSAGRCRNQFAGVNDDGLFSHLFPGDGTFLVTVASEHPGMESDTTMHCTLIYVLTMNMLDAFKHYRHRIPAWMSSGLAHWFTREIDPSRNYFTQERIFERNDDDVWNWGPRVRARVGHEYFPAFTEMVEWPDAYGMKYIEHMMAWSRVDFLMQTRREGFAKWFDLVKAPFVNSPPPHAELVTRQMEALKSAWDFDAGGFDAAWAEWAADHYPKK